MTEDAISYKKSMVRDVASNIFYSVFNQWVIKNNVLITIYGVIVLIKSEELLLVIFRSVDSIAPSP